MKYVYDCEVINNKLYLKLGTFDGTKLNTEFISLQDFFSRKTEVENCKIVGQTVLFENKTCHSAQELKDAIQVRGNIEVGIAPDGRKAVIDKMGRLVYQNATPLTTGGQMIKNIMEHHAEYVAKQQSADIAAQQSLDANTFAKNEIDILVDKLNVARNAYYNENREIMSNKEYDELYDRLETLENRTGYIRKDSPTQNIGAELQQNTPPVEQLKDYSQYKQGDKIQLDNAALSLDKTKDVNVLAELLNNGDGLLSVKMDGLTVNLTYSGTELALAATRGNGYIGEVCTENAKSMIGVPNTIPYGKELKVRGEAYINYDDFDALNASLPEEEQYINPRNLASGTTRSFGKPDLVRKRHVRFCAYEIINWKDLGLETFEQQLGYLRQLGFTDIVKYIPTTKGNVPAAVEALTSDVKSSSLPADGLVLRLNNLIAGERLGVATKFPRHSLAFKWEDTEVETELLDIDWTTGRTGVITPTAVFKPVFIEGSTIQRASVHNISTLEDIFNMPYTGQKIMVYKANLIIPQVASADLSITPNEQQILNIPTVCPLCGHPTVVKTNPTSGVKTLWCENDNCGARGLQNWVHFVSRDAMNINGLGESILQDMYDLEIINNRFSSIYTATPYDMFRLCTELEGYGEKKVTNILDAIQASKNTSLENVLYAFGIPNIGLQTAKQIVKLANSDLDELSSPMMLHKILNTNGLGPVVANSWKQFMTSDKVLDFFDVCDNLILKQPVQTTSELNGLTFCCTGDVYQYKNRKELQASIEQRGGKFTTSVTGNTNYLITNDTGTGSAKNKAAKAKGIPIITEQQFIDMFGH